MTQQMFEQSSLLLLICLGYFPWVIILCWTGYHMPSVLWPESAWSFFPYGCLEPGWRAVRLFRCLGPWGLHRIPSLGGAWDLRLAWISLKSRLKLVLGPEAAWSLYLGEPLGFCCCGSAEEACDDNLDPLLGQGIVEIKGSLLDYSSLI